MNAEVRWHSDRVLVFLLVSAEMVVRKLQLSQCVARQLRFRPLHHFIVPHSAPYRVIFQAQSDIARNLGGSLFLAVTATARPRLGRFLGILFPAREPIPKSYSVARFLSPSVSADAAT